MSVPLFYFHIENDVSTLDHYGVDLLDITAAKAEAITTVAAMLRDDNVHILWAGKPLRLWVTAEPDGEGKTLFALHVTAIEPDNSGPRTAVDSAQS